MKLRTLRKLEEIEIEREKSDLETEQTQLKKLLSDERLQWKTITQLVKDLRKKFDPQHDGCARRTSFGQVADIDLNDTEAFIERELVTVICSKNMWLRIHKGHHVNPAEIKYKEGDQEQFILNAETTDKLLIFTTAGRFYTVPVDKLPSGRGLGEPLSLMVTLVGQETIVNIFIYNQQLSHYKFFMASFDGRGFIVQARDVIAATKTGKQILNVTAKGSAVQCIIVNGDHVAIVGTNRKLVIIPISEFPEMRRGRGVVLQKYRDAELSDMISFNLSDGLSWQTGGRTRTDNNILTWVAKRGQAGRMVPNGFPKNNRFK